MKAPFILRQNILSLLADRKESQTALATWVGHHKTWVSKFLTGERDELQLADLDRVADFFRLSAYQLFQPGISRLTERRSGVERRTGNERRVGHTGRLVESLRTELNKVPSLASDVSRGVSAASSVPPAIRAIIEEADRRIAAYYAREQTASARSSRAGGTKDRRNARRPDAETA